MLQVIEKVENELEKLGLTMDDVANEHIIEACTAKVALVLDEGGSGEDVISSFLIGAVFHSPELRDILEISLEE